MGPVALSGADYSPSGTCTGPRTSSTCTTGSADTHCSLGRNCVMRVAITVMVGHEFLRWSSAPRPTATAAPLSITGPGVYSADAHSSASTICRTGWEPAPVRTASRRRLPTWTPP